MITVVTPVSPIPSHPDIGILEETIASVRHHLPDAEVMLLFDGVRAELEHRREAYEESIADTLWAAKHWGAVCPWVFDDHRHQVGMLRYVIGEIRTPLMVFVEQDAPLERDHIDWDACIKRIAAGADVVRFYHESEIHPDHQYLMREREGDFVRTLQYSARPHLATVNYYKRVLAENFSERAVTFVEDVLHGAAQCEPDRHNLWIYAPEGNIRRSYHLDGRAGDPKFEELLRF